MKELCVRSLVALLRACEGKERESERENEWLGGWGGGGGWFLWHPGHRERKCKRKATGDKEKHFDCVPPHSVWLVWKNSDCRLIRGINAAAAHKDAAITNYQPGLNCCIQSGGEHDLPFRLKHVEMMRVKYTQRKCCIMNRYMLTGRLFRGTT